MRHRFVARAHPIVRLPSPSSSATPGQEGRRRRGAALCRARPRLRVAALCLAGLTGVGGIEARAAMPLEPTGVTPAMGALRANAAAAAEAGTDTPTPFGRLHAVVESMQPQHAPQNVPQEEPETEVRLRSWEMEPIEIVGEAPPALREEELIGPYRQPRWTAHRRFATTRTYVIPEGEIDAEYWARIDTPKHGHTKIRNLYEVEIGLPNRFQLDLYMRAQNDDGEWDPTDINGQMIELRYALANWGEIWGNPTLYLEWVNNYREPDAWEGKLLFADQLAPSWHWTANLSTEQQTTGAKEREVQFTYGLSKTITDEKFSVGGEFLAQRVNAEKNRDDFTDEFFLGPSFQYKPSKRTHIDFAPLAGLGGESGKARIFFIFGYEF